MKKRFPKLFNNDYESFITDKLNKIETLWTDVNDAMVSINTNLDNAIHGHNNAKRQIERIIGEWMNGEQTGYCFGFEGPPGVGKTSLAKKGLVQCLKGVDGKFRPFAFIAMGGSSNGSTLQGHNYTYVGSTWGRIVDILMETKCMNPIIFIDELDKISKSEHGKELIGILTHLVDGTQNEGFQDKYFSGIDLDLSKALFIFSYNDAQLIDRILLDRIHRVKFDSLSVTDKLTITNKYLLPEIYKKIQLKDTIRFPDEIITYIIKTYTYEAGVRKLKEILTEIIREINLEILTKKRSIDEIPIIITKEEVRSNYLKERHEIVPKTIHSKPDIGIINGLWANSLGKGGIIPIEVCWSLANNPLDFKLTGLQGDVMKESMHVAKTLAWKLSKKNHVSLFKKFKKNKMQGLHVHCPEGATPKDGPSAGTAITTAIYSLFNSKKIKNNIAITGEMNLQGRVTAIGGLNLKIVGGIEAGITEFIYPKENHKDFILFMEKYEDDKSVFDNIVFHEVENIEQVLDLVFI
jgi:ATP-dependent Lon protease